MQVHFDTARCTYICYNDNSPFYLIDDFLLNMHELAHFAPLGKDIPPTKRGHERCVALLVSATELFLERGYDAVSLDDIVQHAGGSKAFDL